MKFICINKCFFKNRLWLPGETLEAKAAEEVNRHFKPYSEEGLATIIKTEAHVSLKAFETEDGKLQRRDIEEGDEPRAMSQMVNRSPVDISHDKPVALSQFGKSKPVAKR